MSSSIRKNKKCKAPNCTKEGTQKGECWTHYQRRRIHGSYKLPERRKLSDPRSKIKTPGKSPAQRKREREAKGELSPKLEGAIEIELQTPRVFIPLLHPMRYKGAHGGRGSGKSHFFAELLIERCLIDPNTRAVCIREVQLSLKESVKRLIEDKIKSMGVSARFNVQKSEIQVKNEHGRICGLIIFMGMQNHTADSIKSLEGYDIAWVEEAHSLSQRSFDLLRPTIRKEKSELWFSWNPESPKDPVDDFFRGKGSEEREDMVCVSANYTDNPFFPEVLRQDMEYDKARDIDRWRHVWGGNYLKLSQSSVFKNFRVGRYEEFETKAFHALVPRYGGDWGYAQDPTVGIKLRVDEKARKLYVEREVYKIGCEVEDSPALFDLLDEGEAREHVFVADSARPETISHCKRHGYPRMIGARKGKDSVKEGVVFLKGYEIIVHPDCIHTHDELVYYSYQVDKHTQEILPVFEDKKNHVIDAMRYAVEPIRHSKKAGVLF